MNNNLKTILLAGVTALVVVGVALWLVGSPTAGLGGPGNNRYPNSGVTARFFNVSTSTPQSAGTDGKLTVGGGTTGILNKCNTATWNPGSIGPYGSSTSTTSTVVTLAGALMGNSCSGSLDSGTSTNADFACDVNGNASATLNLYNTGATALDLATGTATVCFTN